MWFVVCGVWCVVCGVCGVCVWCVCVVWSVWCVCGVCGVCVCDCTWFEGWAVGVWGAVVITFLFLGLHEGRSLQQNIGHTRRIALSHCGCCCLHKQTWSSTETNNTKISTLIASYIAVDRGIFESLLLTVTNLSFKPNLKLKIKSTLSHCSLFPLRMSLVLRPNGCHFVSIQNQTLACLMCVAPCIIVITEE